jgi:VWFA-related protein
VLYSLWLNTEYESLSPLDTQPEAFDAGHDRMKEMAETGGGIFYEVERLDDLAGAYEQVVADLGTVYSLAYRPSDKTRDGKWRAIRVNVARPTAVARGKRGYYAN